VNIRNFFARFAKCCDRHGLSITALLDWFARTLIAEVIQQVDEFVRSFMMWEDYGAGANFDRGEVEPQSGSFSTAIRRFFESVVRDLASTLPATMRRRGLFKNLTWIYASLNQPSIA